jgi:uncharacterized protein (TIGR03067 family)
MVYMMTLMATAFLVGADDVKKSDPLTGTWVVISVTHGGNDQPNCKESTVSFADGKITIKEKNGGLEHVGTYTLDSSKKPATIDLVPGDGSEAGMTLKGLFAVEKDELKLCLAQASKDRPTALSSKAGEETTLVVLKKAEKK